jgi:hypothetical protein
MGELRMKRLVIAAAAAVCVASSADAAQLDIFLGVLGSGAEGEKFASSVALSRDTFVVGSTNDAGNGLVWNYDAAIGTVRWSTTSGAGQFGSAVAMSGDEVLVGAPPGPADAPGTVSRLDADTGAILTITGDPFPARAEALGTSVALGGGLSFAGAPSLGSDSGSVYSFEDTGQTRWQTTGTGSLPGDKFGSSLSLDGERLLVGAARDSGIAASTGSVHLLNALTGEILQSIYNPEPDLDRIFGTSVAIYGDRALVGATPESAGSDFGAAYMFDLITGNVIWATLGDDLFGSSLAFDGKYALIGAAAYSDDTASVGSAYLLDAMTGQVLQVIDNPDSASGDLFGSSVALFGNKALIGAERNLEVEGSRGSAWLYTMPTATPVPLPATAPLLLGTLGFLVISSLRRRSLREK